MNDKAETRRQRKFQEADLAARNLALKSLISAYEGRKLLWHLLQIGRVGSQPYNGNAIGTAFNCGELNVGQRILADIMEVDPMAYGRMMQESQDEHTQRNPVIREWSGDDAADTDRAGDDYAST